MVLIGSAAYAPTVLVAGHRPDALHGIHPNTGSGDASYPTWRLLHLSDGSCRLHISGREITVRAGALLLLHPGEPYAPLSLSAGCKGIHCSFTVRAGEHSASNWDRPRRLQHPCEPSALETWGCPLPTILGGTEAQHLTTLLQQIAACWWRNLAGLSHANRLLHDLLIDLALPRMPAQALITPSKQSRLNRGEQRRQMTILVDDALSKSQTPGTPRLDVKTLARLAGVSESTIRREYHRRNARPGQALRQTRLANAAHLLATTSQPVASIAAACGWRSAAAFSRAFAQAYGQSPRSWRHERHHHQAPPGTDDSQAL